MRLPEALVAQIKACAHVYSLSDTARHFGVSKDTVHRIWSGKAHSGVPVALEPPNVNTSRVSPDVIREDGRTLLQRYNGDMARVAEELGISERTLYRYINGKGAGLYLA